MEPSQNPTSISEEAARGCIFGALCGDAIGAYLEFKALITTKDIETAFTLPGGGLHKIGKGQITDDSELMLCLGHGLSETKGQLNLNKIAEYYGKWVKSRPFDMGSTIRNALPKAVDMKVHQARMVRSGAKRSTMSQSNGALMRIAPMCIFVSKMERDDLIKAVTEETKLTHPNQVAIDVSIAYAYTIRYLLRNFGDYEGAYKACKEILESIKSTEVLGWLNEMERGEMTDVTKGSGWVKHAFMYGMDYLRKNMDYVDALKDMLSKKGDTDTNCCIVGGLLGALHGVGKLPQDVIEKVMKFDPAKNKGIKRPEFLVPGKCIEGIIGNILRNAPEVLGEIVGAEEEDEKVKKEVAQKK